MIGQKRYFCILYNICTNKITYKLAYIINQNSMVTTNVLTVLCISA
jgi:hypothetical protein